MRRPYSAFPLYLFRILVSLGLWLLFEFGLATNAQSRVGYLFETGR